jgi:uncharacterized membrane protein
MTTTASRGRARRSGVSELRILGQAAVLGMVTGMRSMLGVRMLAASARRGAFNGRRGRFWRALRSPVVKPVLSALSTGELLVDKLPFVPSRLAPGPLGARIVLGALVGGAVSARSRRRETRIAGAVFGAAAAVVGALAGNRTRAWLDRETRIPSAVTAMLEDSFAMWLGAAALPA